MTTYRSHATAALWQLYGVHIQAPFINKSRTEVFNIKDYYTADLDQDQYPSEPTSSVPQGAAPDCYWYEQCGEQCTDCTCYDPASGNSIDLECQRSNFRTEFFEYVYQDEPEVD